MVLTSFDGVSSPSVNLLLEDYNIRGDMERFLEEEIWTCIW